MVIIENVFQKNGSLFSRKKKRSINSRMGSCPLHFGTRSRFFGTLFFLKKRLSRFWNAFYFMIIFHWDGASTAGYVTLLSFLKLIKTNLWAKSMIRISWINININPQILPITIKAKKNNFYIRWNYGL